MKNGVTDIKMKSIKKYFIFIVVFTILIPSTIYKTSAITENNTVVKIESHNNFIDASNLNEREFLMVDLVEALNSNEDDYFRNYSIVFYNKYINFGLISMEDDSHNQFTMKISSNSITISNEAGEVLGESVLASKVIFPLYHDVVTLASGWSGYYYIGDRNASLSWSQSIAQDAAVAIILGLITAGIATYLQIAISVVGGIASSIGVKIYNDYMRNIIYRRSLSQWSGCPILVRDMIQIYNKSLTTFYGIKYVDPYWLGDKWNYSYPAACRTAPY